MIWEREVQIRMHPREPSQEVLRDTGLWPQSHVYMNTAHEQSHHIYSPNPAREHNSYNKSKDSNFILKADDGNKVKTKLEHYVGSSTERSDRKTAQ